MKIIYIYIKRERERERERERWNCYLNMRWYSNKQVIISLFQMLIMGIFAESWIGYNHIRAKLR